MKTLAGLFCGLMLIVGMAAYTQSVPMGALPSNSTVVTVPPPNGAWKLCGDTTISSGCVPSTSTVAYDFSGNGNNGTWAGTQSGTSFWYSASTYSLPYMGYFDGTNNVVSATPPTGVSSVTVNFWMNLSSFPASGAGLPVYWGDQTANGVGVSIGANGTACGNGHYLTMYLAGHSCAGSPSYLLSLGTLYMVTFQYSAGTTAMYVDGSLVGGGSFTWGTPNPNTIFIGNGSATGANWVNGSIGLVQFYNSILSAGQISTLYSTQVELFYPKLFDTNKPAWAWMHEDMRNMIRRLDGKQSIFSHRTA